MCVAKSHKGQAGTSLAFSPYNNESNYSNWPIGLKCMLPDK